MCVTVVPTTFVPASFDPDDFGAPFYSQFKGQIFDEEQATFDLPDTLVLGFALRPLDTLVLSFEYDRVWYSQISDNNVEVFGIEERDPVNGQDHCGSDSSGPGVPGRESDSGRRRVRNRPSRRRTWHSESEAGYDPDHRMRFELSDAAHKALFRPGADEFHVAPGIGFSFDRFQIDAALDISTRVNTLVGFVGLPVLRAGEVIVGVGRHWVRL